MQNTFSVPRQIIHSKKDKAKEHTKKIHAFILLQLGKMRMTVPSRASTCSHLQCFDAPMFLMMNEKKPTWTCPVCDKAAEFSKLVIDGYEILYEY